MDAARPRADDALVCLEHLLITLGLRVHWVSMERLHGFI
jgi:hypothetical protein